MTPAQRESLEEWLSRYGLPGAEMPDNVRVLLAAYDAQVEQLRQQAAELALLRSIFSDRVSIEAPESLRLAREEGRREERLELANAVEARRFNYNLESCQAFDRGDRDAATASARRRSAMEEVLAIIRLRNHSEGKPSPFPAQSSLGLDVVPAPLPLQLLEIGDAVVVDNVEGRHFVRRPNPGETANARIVSRSSSSGSRVTVEWISPPV